MSNNPGKSPVGSPDRPQGTALTASLKVGSLFQGLEVLEVLGQGGMGIVYKARQKSLDRLVALKLLAPWLAESQDFARRFDREAKALAALNDPHVVHVYDFGKEEDLHFLTMEYVDGRTLEEILQNGQPLDLDWFLRILRDVAMGLEKVHAAGLVHRDIKPSNILIATDGTAKLGDFGLAIETEDALRITESGVFAGSPHYVSPEHVQGKRVDGRSDLYSLGVILYEGIAGQPPFSGPTTAAILMKHVHEQAPPLYKRAPQAPSILGELTRKLLAKNPGARIDSAAAVRRELDRAIELLAEQKRTAAKAPPRTSMSEPGRVQAVAPTVNAGVLGNGKVRLWMILGVIGGAILVALLFVMTGDPGAGSSKRTQFHAPANGTLVRSSESETSAHGDPKKSEGDKPSAVVGSPSGEPLRPESGQTLRPDPAESKTNTSPSETDKVLERADLLLAQAKAAYEEARDKGLVEGFVGAGFKLEEARMKYLVLQEVGSSEKQTLAAQRLMAVNQLGKLIHDGKVAISGSPVEPPAAKPSESAPPSREPSPPVTVEPAAKLAADKPLRMPVPDPGRQREAETLIKDLYKGQYASRIPVEHMALARTLLGEVEKNTGEPAAQWVLCREAQELAIKVCDVKTAVQAVERAARLFDVDGLTLKGAVLQSTAKYATLPEEFTALAEAELKLIDEAITVDLYDPAEKAVVSAQTYARRSGNAGLAARTSARAKEVSELRSRFQSTKKSREALSVNPEDPRANLEVGQFLCMTKGDWELGLRHLAKGPDGPLKTLAQKELAPPAATEDWVSLGDGWFDLAEKEKSPIQKGQLLSRAKTHYEQALPQLTGLQRTKVEKRLASELLASDSTSVNLLALIDLRQDVGAGNWKRNGLALVTPATNPSDGSIPAIRIPYIPPAEYDVKVVAASSGAIGSLDLGLMGPAGQFSVLFDSFAETWTALHMVDGKGGLTNGTAYTSKVFVDTQPKTLLVSVRKGGVSVTVDGKVVLNWKGDLSRLSFDSGAYRNVPDRRAMFLTTLQSYQITKIELTPVSGSGKRTR